MNWKVLQLVWLSCVLTAHLAAAQTTPITVDISQTAQFPKGNGPLSFVWQCSVSTPDLLEGHFLVTAYDGNEQFGQFQSHDVALHSGFHEVPMMLPPMKVDNAYSELKLRLSFITPETRYDFKDPYTLKVGRKYLRTLTVGVCDPFIENLPPALKTFLDQLKFEAISPVGPIQIDHGQGEVPPHVANQGAKIAPPLKFNLKTYSIHLHPEDFPKLPVDCHQYDILVITARGLEALESRHLNAILQWVRSGGSLCVLPGESTGPKQLVFLNALQEREGGSPLLQNSKGQIDFSDENQILFTRTGWGRSIILRQQTLEKGSLTSDEQARIPFFLWKLKQSQKKFYDQRHHWDDQKLIQDYFQREQQTNYRNYNAYAASEVLSMAYQPLFTGGMLITDLMPAELQIVPTWIIGTILLGYVLMIGPGEYYLLGYFKIRRFTWLTFPVISIFVALFAFVISNYFMQASHERKPLSIIDLDSKGRPVRENEIELLFTGSYQTIETRIKSGLFSPLNQTELGRGFNNYNSPQSTSPAMVGAPFYQGSIPTQYSVYQRMPQWTPQLNRIVNNYPQQEQPGFDWSSITVDQLNSNDRRAKLKTQVKQAYGENAILLIYRGTTGGKPKRYTVYMNARLSGNPVHAIGGTALLTPIHRPHTQYQIQSQEQICFMDDLCVRQQQGIFQIVSQTSPAGGSNLEDLSILDSTDPRQWLVVVYVPGKQQNTIYRQLIVSDT
ncbi:hypothetical protein [Gimesia algae]|uniref:DUF4350 domain-containing protein n=1 Tax=Gimesia algae TaxID=2527971 RepID=A0A517V7B4_9PLAN|nr:hypothetical protein [Gimesia algae]QDT88889.1 hypothetical protein Pan161_05080 [Gimesia algae]